MGEKLLYRTHLKPQAVEFDVVEPRKAAVARLALQRADHLADRRGLSRARDAGDVETAAFAVRAGADGLLHELEDLLAFAFAARQDARGFRERQRDARAPERGRGRGAVHFRRRERAQTHDAAVAGRFRGRASRRGEVPG